MTTGQWAKVSTHGHTTLATYTLDQLPSLGELADLDKPCYDKVALLIGNRNYRVGKMMLNTPENDTQDLGGVLRSAGFKVVSLVNLSKQEMEQVFMPLGDL